MFNEFFLGGQIEYGTLKKSLRLSVKKDALEFY